MKYFLLIFSMVLLLITLAFSAELLKINDEFLKKVYTCDPIERDLLFEKHLNSNVYGKGYVVSVKEKPTHNKKYRVTLSVNSKLIDIKYFLYTDKKEYLDLLQKGDLFEFKGKLSVYTPINKARTKYIIDVLLDEGAVIVE